MIIKLLSLLSLCILTNTVHARVKDSTSAQLKLKGPVQSVEINVVSYDRFKEGKRITTKSIGKAKYQFSKEGLIVTKFDNIPEHYKPNRIKQVDTLIYHVDTSNDNLIIASKKLSDTTREYEIRYIEYNENNLLTQDSTRHGQFLETRFTEGPVITKFLDDQHGNVIYTWFKSSFVFAIWDHWHFEYTYDSRGNWIKMTRYRINQSPSTPLLLESYEGIELSKEWEVERVIEYY